jgi:hypothetical protein
MSAMASIGRVWTQRRHHVNQLHAALQTLKPLAGCPGGLVFGFQSGDHGRGR